MAESDAFVLRVTSRKYAPNHPAWHDQVALLDRSLRELRPAPGDAVEGVSLRVQIGSPEPIEGPAKGLVEISAVVLASTQMIHAAAVIIREWAKLDASREFSVEKQKDGTIVFKGRGGAGVEAVRDALLAHLESKVLGTTPHELAPADAESADEVR